jgi:thioredoxin reductase
MHDVIIIGGSFAGLAAATQLGRARRDVVVLDTGLPRNRFSPAAHGILGHDGLPPGEILAKARDQLETYKTVQRIASAALTVSGSSDAFVVDTDSGPLSARRLILAYGVSDTLPPIDGSQACWGLSALHCPYCHGFEFGDRRLAYIGFEGHELMMARLYRDWSRDLVMFSNGRVIDAETRTALEALGVPIVQAPIRAIRHQDGHLTHIETAEGAIARDAIFVPTQTAPSRDFHLALGCETDQMMINTFIKVDERQQTTVPGVYAAGDLSRPMHNATFAISTGVMAGAMSHHSLLG